MITTFIEPDATQKRSRLTVPRSKNTQPCISSISSPGFKDVAVHHEPELRGAFKRMAEKGIRWTSYSTTEREYDEE